MEVLGLAAASMLSKYRKIATFDELLERLFFLGKASVAILLFFIGVPHLVSYLLVWTGTSFLTYKCKKRRQIAELVGYFFFFSCGTSRRLVWCAFRIGRNTCELL